MKRNNRLKYVAVLAVFAAFAIGAVNAGEALAQATCRFPSSGWYGFPAVGNYITQNVSCPTHGTISGYGRSWNQSDSGKALQVEWYQNTTCTFGSGCRMEAEGFNSSSVKTCGAIVTSAGTTNFNACPSTTTKWKAEISRLLG